MSRPQPPPQRISAPSPTSTPATFIFLHGFGDDADGWTNIAHQFHTAQKLPHLTWLFPTAPHNHESMTNAWYTPSSFAFSPIPVGRSSTQDQEQANTEDEEEHDEAEDEILASASYICDLIDAEISRGVPVNRIIVGGFSQGCAVSLVVGLASRYKGLLGGIVGLSGYLPRGEKIGREKKDYAKAGGEGMRVFMAHGKRDVLVPMRVFRDTKGRVERTVGGDVLECHEYEGLGHGTSGPEFRDMCAFLERVVPG